jgi:hypothetical protein
MQKKDRKLRSLSIDAYFLFIAVERLIYPDVMSELGL